MALSEVGEADISGLVLVLVLEVLVVVVVLEELGVEECVDVVLVDTCH
jgi:hypothetical protein